MNATLSPLEPPYNDTVSQLLSRYPDSERYLLKLFRVFANSERFLRKGVHNLLDPDSPLTLRERELIILRVTANLDCGYEWGVHAAVFGRKAGFSDTDVAATAAPDCRAAAWSETDLLLLEVIDQLCAGGRLTGVVLDGFRDRWTLAQQLEILALAGNYHTVAFVANAADLDPEPFAAEFPRRPASGA